MRRRVHEGLVDFRWDAVVVIKPVVWIPRIGVSTELYLHNAIIRVIADGLDIRRLNGSSFHKGDFLNGLFENYSGAVDFYAIQ
jgi:hypothetical protein